MKGVNPLSGDKWDNKAGNLIGFINPIMMLHALYGVFDPSIYETDIATKIKIEPIININGENKFAEIGSYEIVHKIGPRNILGKNFKDTNKEFTYYPNPVSNKNSDVPANISISIIESNKLGDYIAKGNDLMK